MKAYSVACRRHPPHAVAAPCARFLCPFFKCLICPILQIPVRSLHNVRESLPVAWNNAVMEKRRKKPVRLVDREAVKTRFIEALSSGVPITQAAVAGGLLTWRPHLRLRKLRVRSLSYPHWCSYISTI